MKELSEKENGVTLSPIPEVPESTPVRKEVETPNVAEVEAHLEPPEFEPLNLVMNRRRSSSDLTQLPLLTDKEGEELEHVERSEHVIKCASCTSEDDMSSGEESYSSEDVVMANLFPDTHKLRPRNNKNEKKKADFLRNRAMGNKHSK